MDWSTILSAVLAGGLAGQLTTLFFGNRFAAKRDLKNWLRAEKFKVFSELVALVSSSSPACGYDQWPREIRALSQKVFLLHPEGKPPDALTSAMETVFQSAYAKRSGEVKDHDEWVEKNRDDARVLRVELAKSLHST
jgi:hypothetical protein